MPLINVGAKCVICEKDMRAEIEDHGYGHLTAELSHLIFCDECRRKLKVLVCGEKEEANEKN